ncbi:MAG: insulinase family protein [Rubrivivax sp.]|jgi:zinc protease|nr:insulinase family protein [Rubrivivax sp.]
MALLRILLLWLAFAGTAAAAALPPGVTEVTRIEGIAEYRLANGLQVLLVPDDSKPTTTVNLTIRVGSRHENYGETGMAHLLEHLIFKGTPTTRNVLGEFGRRGMRANGTTSYDRTNYFASFAANDEHLRWYLAWAADAMVNSFIAREDLDTEMTVVRNEMEAGENDAGRILLQRTMATMYEWHNYGKTVIGARSDVENVDISRLQAFYRKHYQPDNATLIVAGKFDAARVLDWIAASFGPIPKPTRALPPTYTLDPAQDGERTVTLRRTGGAPFVLVGFHAPAGAHPDFAAIEMLAGVLGDTPGGRLHRALVPTQLAAAAFAFAWPMREPSPLFLGAQLAPGQDVVQARDAILAAVDALADDQPVTAEELERARTQWLNGWERGFTDPETIGVELSDAIALGDWRLFFKARDRVRAVQLGDVQRVARSWLVRDNRTIGTYLPTTQPERAPAPAHVDVAALLAGYRGDPGAAAVEAFDPSPANLDRRTQTFALASGLQVALLPKATRGRLVQARLRLNVGDADSLRGEATVMSFAAALLDKGGAGMTRQQIADEFDRLRAQVRFFAGEQSLNASITTTREHLPAVVVLVGRLMREPAYAADTLEELRRQALAGIERERKDPGAVAAQALARHGNPYPRGDLRHAPSFDERIEDLRAVSVDRLRAFHRRFAHAASGQFSAAGDLDPAALRAALEQVFGDWREPAAGPQPWVRVPRPFIAVPPVRLVLATPDRQNANLAIELPLALSDTDPDHAALMMANHLLGGSLSSRLWVRIRETEGLSYDVRSSIDWNPHEPNSSWSASAIFAPQNRARVEAALREEVDRALKDGFTQAELDAGRTGLLDARRLARAQDTVVAGGLVTNLLLGRTFARSQQVDDALRALTLQQVNDALRRHLDPSKWAAAWAGDFGAQAPN